MIILNVADYYSVNRPYSREPYTETTRMLLNHFDYEFYELSSKEEQKACFKTIAFLRNSPAHQHRMYIKESLEEIVTLIKQFQN